ncbi:MAG: DNA helicase [Chlorobi bacterium]|nr:MAG: N-6 DNA methylase [Bacteroidota bacterium]MBE2265797.1 N-6 DNA methylase [Flavobacteriales bacterium]MBL1161110.1 DNA helicase [Chlorobiota bacterium]MBZ0194525.1 N-6 DNA methylase [Candidatus Kapabacteria bacterium]MCL4277797.1 N-6 DNA methylase [Ignavibacteria bacterium]
MLSLKPTHKPIQDYYAELERYEHHGHDNEMTVRNAFQNLLEFYARKMNWQFIEEFAIKRGGRRDASVDGALLDQFSLPRAFWEAKDSKDDLAKEVQNKFSDGYPTTNILFWQPGRAILYQDARLILDADITVPAKLVEVLEALFNFDLPYIKEWEHAVEEFKEKIPTLAEGVLKILEEQRVKNRAFSSAFDKFMQLAKESINPNLSIEAVEEMLIQHLLTRRIFRTIFHSESFLQKNAVARELEGVITHMVQGYGSVDQFLKPLDRFYRALEMAAESTDDYAQKQTFLNTVYEKFFQGYAVKVADTHGIVYTPQPIVDFMVKSVQGALEMDFGKSLTDEGVHILDPFVGTGNFILRVMREIYEKNPASLRHKYLHELHCNEVMLLPYYIACLNVEHLYMELTGEYEPFPGICLVDSFELVEELQLGMFTNENSMRVQEQKEAPIFVVIGNPPYNAGQVNENDNNKNRKYPAIDKRVAETYAKDSKASNKNALSDPYVKAFRMASDRILVRGEGMVCLVTNNAYLDGIAFDGMRSHLGRDFDLISLIDLGGNVRKNPKLSGTTHNVFGIQVGVAICMMEHHADGSDSQLRYARMDEFWTKTEKYRQLQRWGEAASVGFTNIQTQRNNVWLTDGMADDWETLIPLGSKEAKAGKADAVFKVVSNGVKTNRDVWAYNFNKDVLSSNMRNHINEYNSWVGRLSVAPPGTIIDSFIEVDDTKLSWSRDLKLDLKRGRTCGYNEASLRPSLYRPFTMEQLYFDRIMNEEVYHFPKIFPLPSTENTVVCVSGVGSSKPFQTLVSNTIPCLDMLEKTQCFPLHVYNEDGTNRRDNITDWGMQQFQEHYTDATITKIDIFHYVYGILHDPAYREKYAANLRRELPRIPFADDFRTVANIGKRLMELHVHYEDQPEYPLDEVWTLPKGYRSAYGSEVSKVEQVPINERYYVTKMKRDKKDPTRLIVNDFLTLTGIPSTVDDYKLGNRSALDWVVDQYQIKTDKRSGITNNPNRDTDPTYIVRLIKKVVTVSVETVGLVGELKGV